MSRHPSPGPSQSLPYGQMFQAPAPSQSQHSSRQKSRAYTTAVAAGAEDVKYQLKYRELKRKVKEIEADNDKLYFKVLQAKKNIQRMRLERAILYERLSSIPPSPDMRGRHQGLPPPPQQQQLPPPLVVPQPGVQPREVHEHGRPIDPNDHAFSEYIRTHENVRVIPGPDGRPLPVTDSTMGPGIPPAPHAHRSIHPSRRNAGSVHDDYRQLPPLQLEQPRGHGNHRSSHTPSSSSHSDSRPHSRSVGQQELHPPQMHTPGVPHPQQLALDVPIHGLQITEIPIDRERPRRYDLQELTIPHSQSRTPPEIQYSPPSPRLLSPEDQISSPTTRSGSGHVHNHQRVGPGANINRSARRRESERQSHWEREREREREREMSRDASTRIPTPPYVARRRPSRERAPEEHTYMSTFRVRDEPDMPERSELQVTSRSDSPGSAGAAVPLSESSRPGSRAQGHDRDRARSYTLRTADQPHADPVINSEHEPASAGDHTRPSFESRKRPRSDMEVESDNGAEGSRGTGENTRGGGYVSDDRRSKRVHPDDASPSSGRNMDALEDNTEPGAV